MQFAKLNVFQRLARQWDALHPYNAAQVMQLSCAPDHHACTCAWRETLEQLGLGSVCIHGRSFRFESLNGQLDRCGVRQFARGTSLSDVLTSGLNQPFHVGDDIPLRPFVLDLENGRAIGVVYHHWVADSVSIRLLLREWFYRMFDPSRARRSPLRTTPSSYWRLFGPGQGRWHFDEGLLASMRWSSRLRRVRRVEIEGFDDYRTRFTMHWLPAGISDLLRAQARRSDVSLNDVLLAALAEVCDRYALVRRTPRRQDLALGTIVDLRARNKQDLSDLFGLFLGFTTVICRPRDLQDWDRLLRCIASQNRTHKQRATPESSMIRMLAGLVAHRLLGPNRIHQFYRKRLPLAGGVSNVNLDGSWVQQYHPHPITDYLRVSPCGPMLPLVVTPTTLGNQMNFGLTCRESVVSVATADALSASFVQRLLRFATREA